MAVLVWFRHDLRLHDQPALHAAVSLGQPIIPVYILADDEEGPWPSGGASRWWLHHSLTALDAELRDRGTRLILRRAFGSGGTLAVLRDLVRECNAHTVVWNRRYEPAAITRDTEIKTALRSDGCEVRSFNGTLLYEPTEIQTKQGKPFQVFSPFWRACQQLPRDLRPLPAAETLAAPTVWPTSDDLNMWQLLPTIPWDRDMREEWTPGEAGAHGRLRAFLRQPVNGYKERRNYPAEIGSSLLSPHLHFGEISPRTILCELAALEPQPPTEDLVHYRSEIGWREFAYHLLYHFPHTDHEPLREQFARFPWRDDDQSRRWLSAWKRGQTGYPIVDAGMRQLRRIGWMHNRVRMIVASFLVKDLLISWQTGAAWFWDNLLDADLASNTLGWQWTAGCGADAAPYFRIFNPVSQGEKFDGNGEYIRRWCPELVRLSNDVIHAPWTASSEQLRQAGIVLGRDYPQPIIDHAGARNEALAALASIKVSQQ